MDALPIQENAGDGGLKDAFCSKNDGVMHACGHDGHLAIMLGVARVLAAAAPTLRGAVKLIFQPAEENAHPEMGPYGGAHEMVAAGVLENPHVDQLFGLHLWSYEPVGTVCVTAGPVMAACDTFHIKVVGQGGHGATPHHCIDCVVVCAALVMQLQTIVSRSQDPMDRAVVTVGSMVAGADGAPNVIPQHAMLHGTARSFSTTAQDTTERRLREICAGVATTYGATIEVEYEKESPAVVNDSACTDRVISAAKQVCSTTTPTACGVLITDGVFAFSPARQVCPTEGFVSSAQATMAAEDVSFFLNAVPGESTAPSGACFILE
jgi:amidohydrolase